MTNEELKAEADANNAAWRCGTFDTKGKEALEYFKNLTHDPQDASMTIEDMEKVIKFHEEELDDYGDDFSDILHIARRLLDTVKTMESERNEAWLLKGRIFNEIDCRIEHGAESNGHLEAIRNLFKENTDGR